MGLEQFRGASELHRVLAWRGVSKTPVDMPQTGIARLSRCRLGRSQTLAEPVIGAGSRPVDQRRSMGKSSPVYTEVTENSGTSWYLRPNVSAGPRFRRTTL
jgi:hypothetical protein